jgi:hypothetical protein
MKVAEMIAEDDRLTAHRGRKEANDIEQIDL